MTFLLDTDICSVHLKDERRLFSRFLQYAGNMYTSRIVVAELYAWAYRSPVFERRMNTIEQLLEFIQVLEFDDACARRFGLLRVQLDQSGTPISPMDLLIAAVASSTVSGY